MELPTCCSDLQGTAFLSHRSADLGFYSPPLSFFLVSRDQTEGPVHSRQATQSGLLNGFISWSDLQTYTAKSVYENEGDLEGEETWKEVRPDSGFDCEAGQQR